MSNLSKKNQRKGLILVCLCIVLLLIYGAARIYALFHSELYANVQLKNGTWNIVVNGTDITNGTDVTFVVDNVEARENEHVKTGNLAPGLTGNFKVSIDPKDTDVSIRYDISIDEDKLSNSNIQIKSVTETQEGNELVKVGKNTYAGTISLEKIKAGDTNEITVEIEWLEDVNNNEPDVELGTTWNAECQIPITVHVCQYLGEKLDPYTEN